MAERTRGDLAIVLHSHMPYVEGFGTYPFGEEWLFDAYARSHLPVLDVADRLTMTVTPVLADQLEADGVGERMLSFLRRHRVDAADRDVADAGAALRPAARADADHYTRAMRSLKRFGGEPLRAFQEAHRKGRIALMPSAATHAVLPKLATAAGRRLQVDAGLRSHERRFGEAGRLGGLVPEAGVGEKAGSALGVVDNRDFEQIVRDLVAEQLLGEEGEVGEVVDDGLGDASPGVADDRSVSELESEDDGRVDSVIEAGDDEHLRRGQAERHGSVGAGELLVALEQGGHLRHGRKPLLTSGRRPPYWTWWTLSTKMSL